MTDPAVPAPREQGWRKLLLALALFLIVPAVTMLRVVVPIEHTVLLLVTALAACTLVGWWAGGRLSLAILWVGVAIGVVRAMSPAGGFYQIVAGWSVLVAATFGLVCLLARGVRFLPRALAALGLAFGAALLLAATGFLPLRRAQAVVTAQYEARGLAGIAERQRAIAADTTGWRELTERMPWVSTGLEIERDMLLRVPPLAARIFPAALALETLAALALAWGIFHRLSRTRIGAPLAPLREFRFNDQLVWGLVVGIALFLLPRLDALDPAGLNLVLFFGALYLLRGLGVLAWFLPLSGFGAALAVMFALLVWPVVTAASVGLGLGDTWFDWRRVPRPTSRSSS